MAGAHFQVETGEGSWALWGLCVCDCGFGRVCELEVGDVYSKYANLITFVYLYSFLICFFFFWCVKKSPGIADTEQNEWSVSLSWSDLQTFEVSR